jgi:hypothetical protein
MAKNKNLSGNLFTRQPLTITETALSASICDYLDARRIYNDRLNSGKIFTGNYVVHLCKTGTPDRFAIVRGTAVFIEVKKKDKKPTPEQTERHAELRRAGAVVITTDSYDDFVRQFKEVESNTKTSMRPGV